MLSLIPLPYRLIAYAVFAAALLAFGYFKGNEHGTAKLTEYIGKQAVEAVRIAGVREKIVTQVQTVYEDRIQKVYVKGDTITKEVTKYVTPTDDAGCAIPVGFVRQYNAAWSNEPTGPPAESDRGPSGVPISEIAAADAGNATSCLAYKAQRDGLIEFYRKQQAVK